MNFSNILKDAKKSTKPSKPVDVYSMVNGKPSNDRICEDMIEGANESPEVAYHMRGLTRSMGFNDEESNLFWG